MRNRTLASFLCFCILFFGCTKSDDSPIDPPTETEFNESFLFNKWWYSTSGSTSIFISSTGSFNQKYSANLEDSGTWEWTNNKHTKMKFTVIPGGANIYNQFWTVFTEIEKSSMKFKFSDDDVDYSNYSFSDSE